MEEVVQMWEVNNSIVNINSQQLTRDGPLSRILRNVMTLSQMVESTRSVNKVMRLPAYRTIWQYCGLALHMKVR